MCGLVRLVIGTYLIVVSPIDRTFCSYYTQTFRNDDEDGRHAQRTALDAACELSDVAPVVGRVAAWASGVG